MDTGPAGGLQIVMFAPPAQLSSSASARVVMQYFPPYANELYERHKGNVHSQNGEDGLIIELLRRLGITGGWVVESGAWDGVHLSNTFALLEMSDGFKALYVEADADKFVELQRTASRMPGRIVAVNDKLQADKDSLGDIMRANGVGDVAVLSIDIDSWDYDVWANLQGYRPAIVVIEIESSVHPCDWKIYGRDGWTTGTSFLPTLLLGARKGYTLVAHCGNMIFVRDDLWHSTGQPEPNPMTCFLPGWIRAKQH